LRLAIPPRVVAVAAPPIIAALASTWRYRARGSDAAWRMLDEGRPFAVALWHDALLALLWRHRNMGIAILVSEARDGQYLADYAHRLGYGAVRGSSRRGATKALLGAVRALESGVRVAFTPDGPVGPRRVLKPGVVAAAQQAGVPIVPLHASAGRAWRLRSWDRFCVPKPFAVVDVAYGEPIEVGPGEDGLARGVEETSAALASLARELEGGE
jgi:lysophospholipid acyltransferase (LPLAT)-like uncharacterized protein